MLEIKLRLLAANQGYTKIMHCFIMLILRLYVVSCKEMDNTRKCLSNNDLEECNNLNDEEIDQKQQLCEFMKVLCFTALA